MPLAPSGSRGYPDWQRIENWDTPSRFSRVNANVGNGDQSPVMDMSSFAYLGGYDGIGIQLCGVQVQWFMDLAASSQIGVRLFTLSSLIPQAAQYRLVNLGPYCRVTWFAISAGPIIHTCNLIGTNRAHPCEVIPTDIAQFQVVGQGISSGGVNTHYFGDYCSGPIELSFLGGSNAGFGWIVQLQYLSSNNVWNDFYYNASTSAVLREIVIAPLAPLRAMITNNTGGATTYNISAIASMTGSG